MPIAPTTSLADAVALVLLARMMVLLARMTVFCPCVVLAIFALLLMIQLTTSYSLTTE